MSQVLTTCGLCGCGCGVYVESTGGRLAGLCPSEFHPINAGRLCIKGWNAIPSLLGQDRLITPLVRKGDSLEPASWDEALSLTASTLVRLSSEFGPQAIGVIGSSGITNEECYSLAKFARCVLRTTNLDSVSRLYDLSTVTGLLETVGVPASQADIGSVADANAILVIGCNVMEQFPLVGSRIEDAARKGSCVISVDPRDTRLDAHASMVVHLRPGTDIVWLRALLRTVLDRRLYVQTESQIAGLEELKNSLADVDIADFAAKCGVAQDSIVNVAEALSEHSSPIIMFGLGVLQQAASTELVKALANLAMLLGGRVMPLRGQANSQGAADLGLSADLLPGYGLFTDRMAREYWERVWECELPEKPGMPVPKMLEACRSGELKALLVFGDNLALSAPNTTETLASLDEVEFLLVTDMYLTETAVRADVVLPACSFLEKDGTFTNLERRIQRVRKVAPSIGQSRSDLAIIASLASLLGAKMSDDPARVMGEISALVSMYRGVTYQSLDEGWGVPWATDGQRMRLSALPPNGHSEDDPEYPFRLISSRINYPHRTGTVCTRDHVLSREYADPYAELGESDAERLGIKPGSLVRISSRSGSVVRRLMLSSSLPAGCVHVPHYFGGDSPNALASYDCDPMSGVPAYKACAVKIEAVR